MLYRQSIEGTDYCTSSKCLVRNSFGVHPYFSRNTLKKVTLLENPASNTISSIVFFVFSSKSFATCKRHSLIFPHLLHFPVKAANADSQMIGYETGSQFLLLNMVIDNLQNRLLELFRFLMCQFTICLFKRADC